MVDANGLGLGIAQGGRPGKSLLVKNTTAADMATIRDVFGYKTDPIDGHTIIFSDPDQAVGACRSGLGDTIFVSAGYTQTIDSAGEIAFDVAGINVIGLGNGTNRPTLTFDGADATPSVTFGAANMRIKNFRVVINEASLTHSFDVGAADDLTIEDCEFVEGTATGLSFITADGTDNDADRLTIRGCRFYAPTAGNFDNAIQLGKDFVNVTIEDCDFDGDFDVAAIDVPAGGNAQVNLQILNCNVKNRLTNTPAISINGTASSGIIKDCLLRTDTKATALDNGSLATSNVRWTDETDQVGDQPIFADVDSAENVLGVNDADNGFDSSTVVANQDGSVLERLEYLQTDNLALPRCVAKTDGAVLSGNDDLFTITGGPVRAKIVGIVTTIIGGNANMDLQIVTTTPAATVNLNAAPVAINDDAAGTSYYNVGATSVFTPVTAGAVLLDPVTVEETEFILPIGTVHARGSAAQSGVIAWYMTYEPLSPSSRVVAAA